MSIAPREAKCDLLWRLCRRHGWASPISKDGLTDLAFKSSSQGQGRELVDDLLDEPFICYQRGRGYWVKNDPDSQAQAAYRLRGVCGYTELQIEATLSRFEQAGGFDAYDEADVMADLDPW